MAQIKDLKRMCAAYEICEACPLYNNCSRPEQFSDNADEIVDKWIKEHPVKTYAMNFFEKFPNAPGGGTPRFCIMNIDKDLKAKCNECSCSDCWNQEIKNGSD